MIIHILKCWYKDIYEKHLVKHFKNVFIVSLLLFSR